MKRTVLLCLLFLTLPIMGASSFSTPEEAYKTYLEACSRGDYKAAQNCYTKSSRELVSQMPEESAPEPEALKMMAEQMEKLSYKIEKVNKKRAIVWFDKESVPPLFLRVQEPGEGWRLDYHFMSHYIQADGDGWSWRNKRVFNLWKSRE